MEYHGLCLMDKMMNKMNKIAWMVKTDCWSYTLVNKVALFYQ